jgi:hypothetical protein
MRNTPAFRTEAAQRLKSLPARPAFKVFAGLDGFVDEIVHAVDKRENAETFTRLPTIASMAERIGGAAGQSTNIEMVPRRTKLGGNGPIMANALAVLGCDVTYVGALGYPNLHPVFQPFSERAKVVSISEPGRTDAVEFLDGKVMLVKSISLNEITWENIQARFGLDRFESHLRQDDLVAFVNWTMIPYMSDLWERLLAEVCPKLAGPRRTIFFDLADPEKRSVQDIQRALLLIGRFEKYFDVVLGLNEKEAGEVAEVLGIPITAGTPEGLAAQSRSIFQRLGIGTLLVHPVTYALTVAAGQVDIVEGAVIQHPVITTGAGDHFNSGFCAGKLLGFDHATSLLMGVSTSGYYVKTGQSPTLADLAGLMLDWPV